MAGYISSTEREKYTKITVPGKDLIQNWWRNKKLFRQTKVKSIQHHLTSFRTNIKGTYISFGCSLEDWFEAETPILWPPDMKSWLICKDSDAGKDWGQGEKGTTEDEMVEWHHHLNGHEFEKPLGVGDGQGSLVCYSPWGCKELDTTELNWFFYI